MLDHITLVWVRLFYVMLGYIVMGEGGLGYVKLG
jgi:hypothetical protein